MSAEEAMEGDDGSQVQVSFTTKLPEELVVTNLPIAVPARLTRRGLSEVINHLLGLEDPRPFDFLIGGDLLRANLSDHLESKQVSTEEVVVVEYVLLPSKPEEQLELPHDDWVSGVSCLPTGHVLSSSYDGHSRIWAPNQDDTPSNANPLAMLAGHAGSVSSCAWGEGGSGETLAVTGGKDFMVRCWAVVMAGAKSNGPVTWAQVFRYSGHEGAVQAVASRGARFCSGSWDKTVKIWDSPDSSEIAEALSEGRGRSRDASAQPRRSKRGKGDDASGEAAPPKERGCVCTLIGHTQAVTGVAWAGEDVVSCAWDHTVRGWDVETQTCTTTLTAGHAANGVAVSSSGVWASAHSDRVVRVWDPRSGDGSLVRSALASHKGWVNAVAWGPDSEHHLVSASHDHTLKLWDVRGSVPLYTIAAHDGKALCVALGAKGQLVSGGSDGRVKMFRAGGEALQQG